MDGAEQVYTANSSFDPFTQSFGLLYPDGRTPLVADISAIMVLQHTAVNQSIAQALQTGAAGMLLLVLLLITSADKRRSYVFILNASALALVIARGTISMVSVTGPFFNAYRWVADYYVDLSGAQNLSSAGEVVSFLLVVVIEISLAVQVRIVCFNLETLRRLAINVFNGLVVFLVCSLRFALMVLNICWNLQNVDKVTAEQFSVIGRLASATNITLVVSIGISTIIFCTKLFFAIRSRHSMGMTQFGPMQIIFVMGCQTMCIPLIFTIVAYFGIKDAQINGVAATVVALSLPLSAMWATANTNERHSTRIIRQHLPIGACDMAKANTVDYYTGTDKSGTLIGDSPGRENYKPSDVEKGHEMQQLGNGHNGDGGVQVERAYCVRSD